MKQQKDAAIRSHTASECNFKQNTGGNANQKGNQVKKGDQKKGGKKGGGKRKRD